MADRLTEAGAARLTEDGSDRLTEDGAGGGPSAPTASFTRTPSSGTIPLAVTFADTSTGSPSSWLWDFGDGGSSTSQNPTHTYTSAGTYTVDLTATNAGGSDSSTLTVTASSAPAAFAAPAEPSPRTRSVTIYIRNGDLAPIAQLDYFVSLRIIERYLGIGKWVLTAPIGAPGIADLLEATDPGIIVQDSVTKAIVFSGPVDVGPGGALTVVRSVSESNGELVSLIQVQGSCDNVWLSHRIAHPEPLTVGPPWSTNEHDVLTGPATSVILDLIDRNAGPSALAERQVDGLTLAADPEAGATVTARARYQPLFGYLVELATLGGVGVEVRQRARTLTASAFAPRDLSADVAFALEFGNLAAYEYSVAPATGTVVYGAGQGEGTARSIVVASTTGRRVETFNDRRDLASTDELTAATAVALTEGLGRTSLTMQPVDTDSCSFGVHYRLGDQVAVVVDGVRTVDSVRVVETAIEGGVVTRTITVGPEDNRGPAALYAGLATLSRRVRQLERI